MSIIAVSNGHYLLTRQLGRRIDRFDEVVRFNDAPIGEYSDHVGTKTTIWAFTDMETNFARFDCRRLWWAPNWKRPAAAPPPGVEIMPTDVEDQIRKATGMPGHVWPTTGLTTLMYLLRQFERIHLAGWYKGPAAFLSHYFGGPDDPNVTLNHLPELEERFIRSLIKQGRLVDVEGR